MRLLRIASTASGMYCLLGISLFGQTIGDYRSNADGNWSTLATWQQCITAGNWSAATSYPGQNAGTGAVTIRNSHAITLNVNPANSINALEFATGTTNATSLTITGRTLNVTNTVTFGAPGHNNGDQTLTIGTGTLNCASLTMPNTSASGRDLLLTISTGSLNVSGSITMEGTSDRNNLTFSGNGTINVGGDFTGGGFTCSTSTVNYNGSGAQNVGSYTYYNLNIATSGTKTLAGAITMRNLAIQNSAVLASDVNAITGNASGTFTMAAGTGLTLGNSGSATAVSFPSNYTTGNTTLNNTSTVTYQTDGAQNVSGVPAYGNVVLATSGTKTMSAALTVNNNLSITGSAALYANTYQITGNVTGIFSMASGTELILGKTNDNTNVVFPLNFTVENINLDTVSTVTYQSSGSQTVSNVPAYGNLTISTNSTTKTCNGDLSVNGNLAINGSSVFSMGTTASSWNIAGNTIIDGSLDFGTVTAKTINLVGDLFDATGTLVMTGTGLTHVLNLGGINNAINTLTTEANGGTVNYNRVGDQQVFQSHNYQNLSVSNGGNKILQGASSVAEVLNLTLGVLQLENFDLALLATSLQP